MNQKREGRFPVRLSALYITEEMKEDLDNALIEQRKIEDNPHIGKPDTLRSALKLGLEILAAQTQTAA